MINTGVSRPIDDLGRVTIPKSLRKTLSLNHYESVEVSVKNGALELKRFDKNSEEIGILRNVDKLGRVVIPMEIRRMFDIDKGDRFLLKLKGNTIIAEIIKNNKQCRCCRGYSKVFSYKDMFLCDECIKGFTKELERTSENE